MQKLIVIGRVQKRLESIKIELKPLLEDFPKLKISTAQPGYLNTVVDSKLDLLIFDCEIINRNIFPFVVQIRKVGFTGPIVVLGKPASNFDIGEFNSVRNLYQVTKPYKADQVLGMVKNCFTIEQMRKRRDQRFAVCENATIEAYNTDFKTETVINNISKSGLRIEGQLSELKTGDLLRLQFNFDKIKKERVMSARVVWVKKDGDNKEQAGLEFVSQKAIYKYLLEEVVA